MDGFSGQIYALGGKVTATETSGSSGGAGTIYLQNFSGEGKLITTGIFP
jgi:hypothetical protein